MKRLLLPIILVLALVLSGCAADDPAYISIANIDNLTSALSVTIGSDTLPTPSELWRGKIYTVYGGAGEADVSYICQKDALDAYNWVELIPQPN